MKAYRIITFVTSVVL